MSEEAAAVGPSSRAGNFDALAAFVDVLAASAQEDAVLESLAEGLVDALDVTCATIGLDRDGQLHTVVAHPAAAQGLCDLQHDVDGSPALTAFAETRVLAVSDISRHPDEWPDYHARAAELGVHSVLSLPLRAGPDVAGAVSVVAPSREWSVEDVTLARTMTALVGVLVAVAETGRQNAVRVEQLQHALDSRVVIEQAKGVLAAAESVSVDQAYARLRAFARSHNAKVEDVAHAVVRLGLRPDAS